MVRAWYLDEDIVAQDQKATDFTDHAVSVEDLKEIGVEYYKIDAETYETNDEYQNLKKQRGYSYSDMITVSPDRLPNYEQKVKHFFEEHLHTDEEIRYILDGSGYFDVRNKKDRWIRIELVKDDLMILPAGIYHRFTLAHKDYIKVIRLFVGEPVWTPHNRPVDNMQQRKDYVQKYIEVR